MGRFNASDVDRYGGSGGGGFFSLKNDGDTARVRFLYNGIDDVEGYAVHEVQVDGKKRYVNCLRDYDEPKSECPFCDANKFQIAKLFIPVYNIDEDKTQIWERGKKMFQKISSICSHYSKGGLVSHIFEIERNGKAGEQTTSYEIYEVEKDDTTLDDLPEQPEVLGGIVLDKTAEEMEYYLENGEFADSDDADEDEAPIRRRSETRRRTPASRKDDY